jgi:hypothetical protein
MFVDTEWTAAPWSEDCELLWVGLADEAGGVWSGVSAEVDLEKMSGSDLIGLMPDHAPRLGRADFGAAIMEVCGDVDEFWAWIPSMEGVAAWFGLGDEAADLYDRYWDVDLQMLQSIVEPWPDHWPTSLCDLNAAAIEAGVAIPPRTPDHLNPEVHARWNCELFRRITESRRG